MIAMHIHRPCGLDRSAAICWRLKDRIETAHGYSFCQQDTGTSDQFDLVDLVKAKSGPGDQQLGRQLPELLVSMHSDCRFDGGLFGFPAIPQHDGKRSQCSQRADHLGPVLVQPWDKPRHFTSPVGVCPSTVQTPGEGVTPRAFAGASPC